MSWEGKAAERGCLVQPDATGGDQAQSLGTPREWGKAEASE